MKFKRAKLFKKGQVVKVIEGGQGLVDGQYAVVDAYEPGGVCEVKIGNGWYDKELLEPVQVGIVNFNAETEKELFLFRALRVEGAKVFLGAKPFSRDIFVKSLKALIENGDDEKLNFKRFDGWVLNKNTNMALPTGDAVEVLNALKGLS